jgi:hypothetical protein
MKLLQWDITKQPPPVESEYIPFMDGLISDLQDIIRDSKFQSKINDFYISKHTDKGFPELWIFAYHEKNNTKPLKKYMKEELDKKGINITFNPRPTEEQIIVGAYSPNLNDDADFRKYLYDNTLICFDLYRSDSSIAKKKALFAKFLINPMGPIEPKLFLNNYFLQNSAHYKRIVSEARDDKFWESFKKYYPNYPTLRPFTPWNHFYFNLILGPDLTRLPLSLLGNIKFWSKALHINITDKEIFEVIQKYH